MNVSGDRSEFGRVGYTRRSFLSSAGTSALLFASAPMHAALANDPHSAATPPIAMPVKAVPRPPLVTRWPPHRPSALRYEMIDGISKYEGQPERELLDDVRENLRDLGYSKACYFGLPDGGSALATLFERIGANAAPLMDDRFNVNPTTKWTYLGIKPVPRHLRVFLLLLTPKRLSTGQRPQSFERHKIALQSGVNQLTDDMQFAVITKQHKLTALVYQYWAEADEEPSFVERSPWTTKEHLKNSGIIDS